MGASALFVIENPGLSVYGGILSCPDLHPIPKSLQNIRFGALLQLITYSFFHVWWVVPILGRGGVSCF